MRSWVWAFLLTIATLFPAIPALSAARKQHTVALGKWLSVKWAVGPEEDRVFTLKVRPLYVDERLKEYVTGEPHEVTERLFVVRRAFRLNDQLPEDKDKKLPRWHWEHSGWLLVDRVTGRVSLLNLPLFDASQSAAAWFRDYAG
jgi:hypothetical protein